MKIIDRAGQGKEEQKSRIVGLIQSRLGPRATKDEQAEETVITALQRFLDNRYVLLRHISLAGLEVPVPLILAGPPGVRVIVASGLKGVYRAREEAWEVLADSSQNFKLAKPNLLNVTALYARVVSAYLANQGLSLPEVEPVLLFADPGIHIDSTRPAVRIVLADAIDRFTAGLTQGGQFLEIEDVNRVVEALAGPQSDEPGGALEQRDRFSMAEEAPPPPPKPIIITEQSEPQVFKKVPFTGRQWLILGGLILANIVILIILVAVVVAVNR